MINVRTLHGALNKRYITYALHYTLLNINQDSLVNRKK